MLRSDCATITPSLSPEHMFKTAILSNGLLQWCPDTKYFKMVQISNKMIKISKMTTQSLYGWPPLPFPPCEAVVAGAGAAGAGAAMVGGEVHPGIPIIPSQAPRAHSHRSTMTWGPKSKMVPSQDPAAPHVIELIRSGFAAVALCLYTVIDAPLHALADIQLISSIVSICGLVTMISIVADWQPIGPVQEI